MKATHKIIALLAGLVLMIAAIVVVSFWSFTQIKETSEVRKHTSLVLNRVDNLLSALKDAETGQRGYLLTGDETFLQPYLMVRDSISGHLKELRQYTLISAAQKHLDALVPMVDAKLAELEHVIELYRKHDEAASLALIRSGEGKRLMDSIRAEMKSIIRVEEDALARHDEEFQSSMSYLLAIIVIFSLLILLLALSFTYLIYRESQQRLKNLVHLETQHLLKIQEETNRQLEQANVTLQVSEEKLAVTLNSIGDGVIATDAEGRVTFLNPLAEQLTGWTQAEATGRPVDEIFNIINQETRQPATIPIKETLAHGTIQGLANHTVLIARDSSECAIADSCAPIHDRDGQVIGAVLVFRDVTEEYATQQALQEKNVELESARSVAEKATLAKSEFLSSMSHELRSPLNAILGFAQLMESDSPPPTSAQKESIVQILQAGWHLLTLINEVLDLAKIESKQTSLSAEPVSLAEVMRECQAMIEPLAHQRGIKPTFPRFDIPRFVRADRTRLKQVLINLLSNAIKYNIKQGKVEVDCTENTPGRIRMSISDTGAGLSPEQLAQLFQPFNRLGQEAGGEEGTGIGLVVAKQLVELMGGAISVESTVGVGSTFWFELTSVDEPHLSMEGSDTELLTQPHVSHEARLRTLLYVEDNPANMKLVEQIIARRPDLRLLIAVTGHLGIELARNAQPEMILMDINLPDISGIEAMKILHQDPVTAHIPIVALSANAMPRDIEKGIKAGFFRYLTKPIKVNEFMDTLNVTLDFAENGGQPAKMKQE